MSEICLSNLEKILQGLRMCKKNEYVKRYDFEARFGEPIVKEMIDMKLIEIRTKGNEEGYAITDAGEGFYSLRKRQNIYSSIISRLKSL